MSPVKNDVRLKDRIDGTQVNLHVYSVLYCLWLTHFI